MILDPEDEKQMERLIEAIFVLGAKYGSEKIGPLLMERIVSRSMPVDMIDRSEEEKSIFLVRLGQGVTEGVAEGVATGMNALHDQMFPFGHPGQAIEISE